ncbi:MAG: GNAT family N-acetyltransferase [Fluviicola sp.]|nr:MAG: GNAT family N-acetyltransferase [Fluviicola sp.]
MKQLNFSNDYILENERVLLRPLRPEDFENLKEFAINEPDLWEYSLLPADGLENMKIYLDAAFADKKKETAYPFIVFDKKTNRFVGSTRFYDYQKKHNTIQLGYTWYGKEAQGTGLNKNCKLLLLEFAFEELELDRVEFRADNKNERSIAAMKSIGCTVEGVLRSNFISRAGRRDSIVLSILRSEWIESVKSRLSETLR